jgi:adenylate cyclase
MSLLATAGEIIDRTGQRVFAPERWRLEGELLAAAGDRGAAERFQRAIDIARRQGARALALRATVSLARLPLPPEARREVRRALRSRRRALREGRDTRDLRDADALLE